MDLTEKRKLRKIKNIPEVLKDFKRPSGYFDHCAIL